MDLDQISDYTGMGRLTWFPRGPDSASECITQHTPNQREALQQPTRLNRAAPKVYLGGETVAMNVADLTAQALPCEPAHAHPLCPHFLIPPTSPPLNTQSFGSH